jgi:hypothetical protein
MFRRLYWVVEQLDTEGRSRVTGVYTSIPDLIHKGLNWCSDFSGKNVRLSLVKPDTFDRPLGMWTPDNLSDFATELSAFIKTNEMTEAEIKDLKAALEQFLATA